ncbi:virulence factor family protein [Pseudomonas fluorescens]|uniref:Virulence factor family protein n=1 Tax=Pseudomonas fluorescens TaxID=294 RepID=A0A944DJF8_PSEFL|nr:AcvB/VirJ family lysyl-phosphatidylglycerol hydrolase [Pseudomonas fluorescens]MBT2295509.1 virulence factor family protein [Pseudomonas fluorescens]MBT2308811.1 virulence factor family protein [Pseudomonas fluorescens]MBT2312436.1 virulence factor family protein [Pseudomonas fluorescens]MBT2317997.1 virulence factor family protein [Pseudomonas fluorescens]MBT2330887.1 virulence factor family protein [Pseudomonas fluorescens]
MMQRSWRYVVATLLVLAVILGGGYWYWNRPAPQPTLAQLTPVDGVPMTRITPGTPPRAQVLVAVNEDQKLSDTQLLALSRSGSAQIVQVILPQDCRLQGRALQAGLKQLQGPATLVSGIGPGAVLAWRWLAEQKNDQAQAVSVDLALEKPGCTHLLPKSAAHGHWLVAWNDNPDDTSAGFVRDQPNAETSISNYDINLPQVLNNELHKILVGTDQGGLSIPVVEVPASQARDTVTLFLSGDGGWRDLDRDVAEEMAKIGYPVVGIDTLRYYWQHKSPEQSAQDLTELMQHYRQVWGTKRFILTGYSFGADVLPAIYNRLPASEQQGVDAIILLAFARTGSFEIEVEGWLGNAGTEAATGPEMAKLPADKVVCIYGVEEAAESGCTDKTAVGEAIQLPGGHHFDENYPALAKRLVDEINKRQHKSAEQ